MSQNIDGYQRRTSALIVLSSLTTAVALFAIFRFTAEVLSVTWIGAWSLLQGLFLIARVSDSGAGNNISRVIAFRVKEGERLDLRSFTVAALGLACAPSVVLTLVTAPAIGFYVVHQFGLDLNADDLWILVWLASLNSMIAAISNVMLAVCEGVFDLNYKSFTVIAGNVAGIVTLIPLLHLAGPAGIGWTYIVMSGTQLVFGWFRFVRLGAREPKVDRSAISAHMRTLWRENLHLSGIALVRLSFEPVTKFLLSLFAPLVVIAQFELALRVTTQIRIVIQSALQPLLALGARDTDSAEAKVYKIFERNDRIVSAVSLAILVAQVCAAPAIQLAGMMYYSPEFLHFYAILAVGNAINTMGVTGYYWQLASGSLKPLLKVQMVMALGNMGIGVCGLAVESPILIVAAYSLAFMVGGLASRSFLIGMSQTKLSVWTLLTLLVGGSISGLVVAVNPTSLIAAAVLLCVGIVVAGTCAVIVYRTSRRA